jgi:branched-chain amino acid aminotransferase
VRAYRSADGAGLNLFRLDDHLTRLRRSMVCVRMAVPYSDAAIRDACRELVRVNGFTKDAHLVIVGYFGLGKDFDPLNHTSDAGLHITAVETDRGTRHAGVAVCVSSWRRISDDTMPPRIKTGANYHNSRLAHQEAVRNGYDTAVFLNQQGNLAEAPGSCLVMIRDGRLITPPGTSGVLEGITLESVAELARNELGLLAERRPIDRTELYVSDEAFLCGTLHEIMPITSVDRVVIGDGATGPTTRKLQDLYEQVVRGHQAYRQWITPVTAGTP